MVNGTRREFIRNGVLGLLGLGALPAIGAAGKSPEDRIDQLASQLTLVPRSEWTAERPRLAYMRASDRFNRMTIHHNGGKVNCHTDRTDVVYDLQGVLVSHMNRNYGDVGYHFIIDYAGRAWEGRSLAYQGAHVGSENAGNIGIMLAGNFEMQQPSPKQTKTMKTLTRFLMAQYGIGSDRIYGHRDLGQSLCPGRNLYPHVLELRAQSGTGRS